MSDRISSNSFSNIDKISKLGKNPENFKYFGELAIMSLLQGKITKKVFLLEYCLMIAQLMNLE